MNKQEMMEIYERVSAAHKYILGFVQDHKLYYVTLSFAELAEYFKLDHASSSRGGKAKIRIRMTSEQRKASLENAVLLGSENMLYDDPANNRGNNFERIIVEMLAHKTWKKDSTPFYVQGDMSLNGEEIQIKFDTAELTNEGCLRKFVAQVA